MSKLRIIGDVHGRYSQYLELIKDIDYSFQVGDMGFNYERLNQLDDHRHFAIKGNHDNYSISHQIFCWCGKLYNVYST